MRIGCLMGCVVVLLASTASGRQSTKYPTPPPAFPNGAASRTQSNRPNVARQPNEGAVAGYVYWDTSIIKHSPPDSCSGLSVTVSVGATVLVTMTDNFASAKNVGNDALCRYAVKGLPVSQALQVQANVKSAAFSPAALSSGGSQTVTITTGGPACFPGGPVDPSLSDLSSGWKSCADVAFNVNFILVPARLATPIGTRAPLTVPGGKPSGSPGTLLVPNQQKTLLPDGSVRPATGGTLAPGRPMSATGTAPGPPLGQSAGTAALATHTKSVAPAQTPIAIRENPNAYAVQTCALDSTFRILSIGGSSDGRTMLPGHQYTIWGCSFGNMPNPKAPKSPNSPAVAVAAHTPPQNEVYLSIPSDGEYFLVPFTSWDDNSILVTIPSTSEEGPLSVPANLTVFRSDKQVVSRGGFNYEIPGSVSSVPPTPALAAQRCAQDNTLRIIAVYPTYGSGTVTELRSNNYYTIAGCSFGSVGQKSLVLLSGGFGPKVTYTSIPGAYSYGQQYGVALAGTLCKSWSDTQIVVFFNQADLPVSVPAGIYPYITEGAAYPGTLSVSRADGTYVAKPGFSFLLKP